MDDQRVLVTAGAAGIGREIVRAFAAGGAAVFVYDLDAKGRAFQRSRPASASALRAALRR